MQKTRFGIWFVDYACPMGVMKMGKMTPRGGWEFRARFIKPIILFLPTSLWFLA